MVFSLILLALLLSIELLLLGQINRFSYKREYIENHINDIQILLLGNSHIECGLNPEYMGGAFNLAISGRAPIYDIELAKRYIPKMDRLEVVIMPLDYLQFYFGREYKNPEEIRDDPGWLKSTYKCMYYKYMGIRVDSAWYWSEIVHSKLDFMRRFWESEDEARECDSLGFDKRVGRPENWTHINLPMLIDHSKAVNQNMYEQLFDCYSILAAMSEQYHVRLILLGTPMYETYQNMMDEKVEKEMVLFVKELQFKYPSVEYYDFTYDTRFGPEDFCDCSHLSALGAEKFSKIVAGILDGATLNRNE